jgi:hypothetical protein
MKAHPRAAMLHVGLKRGALCGLFGARVQKHDHLIRGKKITVQVVPIGCGVEREMVSRRHFGKPAAGFIDKADVGRVQLGGIERDNFERGRWR